MKKLLITFFILLNISLYSNDGVYLSHGGVIFPINENNISMNKEILSFKVIDKICYVDIQFTFNNPDKENKKILVGFQAPRPFGDVARKDKINGIKDFMVFYNGKILPYQSKMAHEPNGKLYDEKDFVVEENAEWDALYVYLFEIEFKPGANQINHSYSFPASRSVMSHQEYDYILTTGAKWSGGLIKDLTVNIDMGSNQYFYVKDIFGKNAEWSIVGTGKKAKEKIANRFHMVRIISGKLQIRVKDFTPKENLSFGIIRNNTFSIYNEAEDRSDPYWKLDKGILELEFYDDENDYSKEQLRFFKNAIYAKYGYDFKDQNFKKLYSQYDWYIANPNLNISEINMTQFDSELLEKITKKEKTME